MTRVCCASGPAARFRAYEGSRKRRASLETLSGERGSMLSRGSSLVESLVAMSIFSIGSAATGAWFVQVLIADARLSRLLAAEAIAASMEARMRFNPVGVSDGDYTVLSDSGASHASGCIQACDTAALAAADVHRFHETLRAHLGETAVGDIQCKKVKTCTVRITWRGREVLLWPFVL